jgi:cell division protein FtsB
MPTDTLTPASPSGVESFLTSTLAAIKPQETTSAAQSPDSSTPAQAPASAAPPSASGPPQTEEKKAEAAPSIPESVQKQLGEQTKANKRLGRENVELKRTLDALKNEIKDLRSKYDGTYQAPTGPTPEQEKALVEFQAREAASRKVAEDQYGSEAIQAKIYAEDSPYRTLISEHPWVHQRVMGSDTPILEALTVLEEFEVWSQFGRTKDAVLTNVEKTVKDKLWKEWTQQMAQTAKPHTGKPVATLGEVRGDESRTAQGRPAPGFSLNQFNRYIP